MARGRFVSKAIIRDRGINELSCDTSRLAFTWLITIADCEGRTVGEPDLLKSALFPRRSDITPEQIEVYINEWVAAGFIIWYYGKDKDRYIQFINFEKHQSGLRKDREAASEIDNPEECRSVDGLTPEEIGLRLRLSKDKEEDEDNDAPSSPLEAAFVESTSINGLKPTPETAYKAYKAMADAGVEPQDIKNAVHILMQKNYTIVGPSSVVNTAITEMSRRKHNNAIPERVYSEVHE
jgi:hypothetical protein